MLNPGVAHMLGGKSRNDRLPVYCRGLRVLFQRRRDDHAMSGKCGHCPLAEGACRGEQHVRFCELVDPGSSEFRPYIVAYLRVEDVQEGYPSPIVQAHNLWRDIKAFVLSGGKLAPKALRAARLGACEPCEKWDRVQRRCTQCGCREDVKVYSLAAECPLGKWPVIGPRGAPAARE